MRIETKMRRFFFLNFQTHTQVRVFVEVRNSRCHRDVMRLSIVFSCSAVGGVGVVVLQVRQMFVESYPSVPGHITVKRDEWLSCRRYDMDRPRPKATYNKTWARMWPCRYINKYHRRQFISPFLSIQNRQQTQTTIYIFYKYIKHIYK